MRDDMWIIFVAHCAGLRKRPLKYLLTRMLLSSADWIMGKELKIHYGFDAVVAVVEAEKKRE